VEKEDEEGELMKRWKVRKGWRRVDERTRVLLGCCKAIQRAGSIFRGGRRVDE
jgi:hypothetical protein